MKIIRVFPRKTNLTPVDELAFIGDPPMVRPDADEVHISVTFTWDAEKAKRLQLAWSQYYPVVKIGGPAFDDPCETFTPGLYLKQGVTFTSRGCNNQCPWCLVSPREGKLRQIEYFAAGRLINDNNFLQCDKSHRAKVYEMLKTQRDIEFIGGLESDLLTEWDVDQMRGLRIHQLFFACDTSGRLKALKRAGAMFNDNTRQKLRCYVLGAFGGQTVSQAVEHLENVWAAGFVPHFQLFQPADKWIKYNPDWLKLARDWIRPAIMRTKHKNTSHCQPAMTI
jgi:hypothetical protein